MITRRDFIRCSCGVAAGAIVAGLGLSFAPSDAHGVEAVTAATLGLVIGGVLAAYGIGTTNYNVGVELGVPEILGNAFLAYSQDAKNYNAAVTAVNSRISDINGSVGFDDTQLYAAISDASYLDGMASAIDSSAGLSLDWLNARGVDQAAFYGLLSGFLGWMMPEPSQLVLETVGKSDLRMLDGNADFYSLYSYYGITPAATDYKKLSDSLAKLGSISYVPVCSTVYSYWSEHDHVWAIYADYYKNSPTFTLGYGTGVNSSKIKTLTANGVGTYTTIGVRYNPATDKVVQSGCNTFDSDTRQCFSISQGEYVLTDVIGSYGFKLSDYLSAGLDVPATGSMSETTTDVGDVGFGGAIIGDGFTADNGMVTGFGSLPIFDPAFVEGTFPGVIDYPFPQALLDWRTGVFNPNDVLSSGVPITDIPGVAAPVPNGIALPTDLPVTVGIPISDGISVPSTETLTLDDIISSGIATSISKGQALPVPVEGTPFYPVNPPGTNSNPPSSLPDFPFPNIFPFNMLFEWLKWVRDNV